MTYLEELRERERLAAEEKEAVIKEADNGMEAAFFLWGAAAAVATE